jgi:hypothetical protein
MAIMENCVRELAELSLATSLQFFHEREIHDEFFRLARERLGTSRTADGVRVHLLRHEYNTVWRYRRRQAICPFEERLFTGGGVAHLDFAVLRPEFVARREYLTVMNKEERLRIRLREEAARANGSPAVERALEFKMAHCHSVGAGGAQRGVRLSDFDSLRNSDACVCRKLAYEHPAIAYVAAFMLPVVGGWFRVDSVIKFFAECRKEWR